MGGAGKALTGGGKVHGTKSPQQTAAGAGYGEIPHPLRLASGQRYTPLRGRRRRPFVVTKVAPDGRVTARREDGSDELVSLTASRLLALNPDGVTGRHYRFVAYKPGRRYRTFAVVDDVDDDAAWLVLPDWHPARRARQPIRLLPPEARTPGAWLACKADLGVASGGSLNIADLHLVADPGETVCRRPLPQPVRRGVPDAHPDDEE
jgi:hypothetical protein